MDEGPLRAPSDSGRLPAFHRARHSGSVAPLLSSAARYTAVQYCVIPSAGGFDIYESYGTRREYVCWVSGGNLPAFFQLAFDAEQRAEPAPLPDFAQFSFEDFKL